MKNHVIKNDGITHEVTVGPVTIDGEPYVSQYQKKDTLSIMLRQVINTRSTYPSAKISNNMQDNLFDLEDFGFGDGQVFNSVQNRTAFLDVPTDSTLAVLTEKVKSYVDACIYRVISNKPILTDSQLSAITNGITTYDVFANSQAIRFPESHETTPNLLILDAWGKVQYRSTFFSRTEKSDEDYRGATAEGYLSPELKAELEALKSGVNTSATLVASQGL